MKYDFLVFIGRFQIFHNGHLSVIKQALLNSHKVIIFVGSANTPRSTRNPFTFEERHDVILASLSEGRERVIILPLEDCTYSDSRWVKAVQDSVNAQCNQKHERVGLIGHAKDHTSFYLKMFPQWDNLGVDNYNNLSSTQMRESLFSNICDAWLKDCDGHKEGDGTRDALVPSSTREFLMNFVKTNAYQQMLAEYEFIRNYKRQWLSTPYPVTFVTVDAVVHQSGHVLLIQRKSSPGKNLWALPGGFINQYERVEDAMIRELREETRIKVPAPVLRGSIVSSKVFDDPHRSSRGRTITHGFHVELRPDTELPAVKGADDALDAKWWLLSDIRRDMMYEDHTDIINYFLG